MTQLGGWEGQGQYASHTQDGDRVPWDSTWVAQDIAQDRRLTGRLVDWSSMGQSMGQLVIGASH